MLLEEGFNLHHFRAQSDVKQALGMMKTQTIKGLRGILKLKPLHQASLFSVHTHTITVYRMS